MKSWTPTELALGDRSSAGIITSHSAAAVRSSSWVRIFCQDTAGFIKSGSVRVRAGAALVEGVCPKLGSVAAGTVAAAVATLAIRFSASRRPILLGSFWLIGRKSTRAAAPLKVPYDLS